MIAEHDPISEANFKNKNIGYKALNRVSTERDTMGTGSVTRLLIHTIKVELRYGLIDNRSCVHHDTYRTERTY